MCENVVGVLGEVTAVTIRGVPERGTIEGGRKDTVTDFLNVKRSRTDKPAPIGYFYMMVHARKLSWFGFPCGRVLGEAMPLCLRHGKIFSQLRDLY